MSACTAKHYMPNIKLIVIFKDPAERAFNAIKYFGRQCILDGQPNCVWRKIGFYDAIRTGLGLLKNSACSFNTGISIIIHKQVLFICILGFGNVTYNDCYKCLTRYRYELSLYYAEKFHYRYGMKTEDFIPEKMQREIITHGLYGAQVAWWFQFFEPNRFLFISTEDFIEVCKLNLELELIIVSNLE